MYLVYILTSVSPSFSPPSLFSPTFPPPSTPLPFLFKRREASQGYQLALAYRIALRLGASSPIEARQGSPVGEKGPKGRQQNQRQPLLPLLRVPIEDQAVQL